MVIFFFFFFKQKTAYEMAQCDWSSDVCSSDLLEPLQASPTIIEDDCFVGARSEVVEGVVVERGSVIGMGVFLGQSTRIYDRATRTISYGRVPAGSVVVSGSLPAADGSHSLYCAVIVKQVDVDAFLERDVLSHITISPTGEYLAMTVPRERDTGLVVMRRADLKVTAA